VVREFLGTDNIQQSFAHWASVSPSELKKTLYFNLTAEEYETVVLITDD